MCEKAVEDEPEILKYVPDYSKTEEVCKEAVRREPWSLEYVPDCFKSAEMCYKAVEKDLYLLEYIPDWFVRQEQIKLWGDDNYHSKDDRLIKWYDGYQKR